MNETGISSARSPFWFYLTILLLMVLGAGFRLIPLQHEALDGDEMFTRRVVLQPLPQAYAMVRDDLVHPPFFYLLLKTGTSMWGTDALGLRLLSLLCGIASIGLIAVLGRRLPDAKWCGLLAAAGMAVGTFQVYFSQDARSYALYTMLVILLLLWVDRISRREREPWLWAFGPCIMLILVYTHYVGSFYVLAAVLALATCKLELRTKVMSVASAAVAALMFIPWLLAISAVYKKKHGIGANLDWQGHPGLYDLKNVWAAAVGVMHFRGAVTVAFLLALAFGMAAMVLTSSKNKLRQSPTIVALATIAVLPPLIVFLLSCPPFNLPIFGLRHLLPSTAALLLLCCYGLERLSQASARRAPIVAICGATLLFVFGATPTIEALRSGPTRIPYDLVAQQVEASERGGTQTFAAWFYGEGQTVNFYCQSTCVQRIPEDESSLPSHLLLLYRPRAEEDKSQYLQLIQSGYVDVRHVFYTDGAANPWGTMATSLERKK